MLSRRLVAAAAAALFFVAIRPSAVLHQPAAADRDLLQHVVPPVVPPVARMPVPATAYSPENITSPPHFYEEVLEGHRKNGYWVELSDLTGNGLPDVLAFGIKVGDVEWYENPYSKGYTGPFNKPWKRHFVDHRLQPISIDHAKITGGRADDFVLATAFGGSPYKINNTGGQIYFYHNPLNRAGGKAGDPWSRHYVGQAVGSHRIKLGHFTRKDRLQLVVVPVAGSFGDPYSVISVMMFTAPADLHAASEWDATVVDNQHFHLAHGVSAGKYEGPDGLDSFIITSMEGVTWVHFDGGQWVRERIAVGVPKGIPSMTASARDTFSGGTEVDVGRIGDDATAFVAIAGPFHGNVVLVYMKVSGAHGSLRGAAWKEYFVHNFDSMTPAVDGSGPIHQVTAADLDSDGDDELLIANKRRGTYYAKISDIARGLTEWSCLTLAPATRLSVADVNGDGLLDFATFGNTITSPSFIPAKLHVYHNLLDLLR